MWFEEPLEKKTASTVLTQQGTDLGDGEQVQDDSIPWHE